MFKEVQVALRQQKAEDLIITALCGSVLPCAYITSVSLAGNSCA